MEAIAAETSATEVPVDETGFSQEQIEHLTSMRFINRIDEHLNIIAGVKFSAATDLVPHYVYLVLDIFYNEQQIERLSFNLKNFSYEDIVYVARNIRSNEFILHEVDMVLFGDIE